MSLLILRGLLLAAEALVISALLPLVSWAVGAFFGKNAALRHLFWLAAFGVLLALPLLSLLLPAHTLMLQQTAPVPVDVAVAAPIAATYVDHWSVESIIAAAVAPLCAIWLGGVAWNLLRLVIGMHGLVRLRRTSTAFSQVRGCDVRLGGGPLTFGFLKPVIILPKDAPSWSRERLDAVLRHELAHVARGDSITQWLAALACAFYWPNPLVWLGAKALRRDAEMAADDMVLASGVQPSVYAAELVRLAAQAHGPRLLAVAMASPSSLEARVTSVLSPTPSRAGVTPMTALKLGLLGSACAVALAFARPDIALAQAAQPAPVTSAPLAAPATPETPAAPAPVHKPHRVVVTDHDKDGVVVQDSVTVDADGNRTETRTTHRMTEAEREQVRAAREQAHAMAEQAREQAHEQAEQARELANAAREQAREQASAAREQANAVRASVNANAQVWRQTGDEIREAVNQAMAEIRPYIREASRDPQAGDKIGRKVSEAMAKVQPQIDAAIARANVAVKVHVDVAPMQPMQPMRPMHVMPPAPAAPPAPMAPPPPPAQ